VKKILVVGLGNPILTDDGVGIRVAEELERRLNPGEADVIGEGLAGIDLLERMAGYERVIIIDAIQTGGEPGRVSRLDIASIQSTRHASSTHDINLATALELGKKLNMPLPKTIDIFTVEATDTTTFSERCTTIVANSIPVCVDMIFKELRKPGMFHDGSGKNL
jgi:hydrogenase maturation protease